jgi:hypothetical protein
LLPRRLSPALVPTAPTACTVTKIEE